MLKENNYIKAWDKKLIHKNLKNIRIPESTIEAYKLQADYKTYSKHNLFGWKIAATSIEGQNEKLVDSSKPQRNSTMVGHNKLRQISRIYNTK